jgi:predicted outer membrane repeat protein
MAAPGAAAQAQSAEDFFKTTPLAMYVASGAGGGYDAIGRLLARHLSRFLPGNPSFVIKNMPGAAGIQAANFIYNSAPKDGAAILAGQNAPLMLPLYRKAFRAVLTDPLFLAEAARERMSIAPLDDRAIESLLVRAYTAPKPIRDRAAVFAAEMN